MRWVALIVALAGCQSGYQDGFAVDLTIAVDDTVSGADLATLALSVSGAEVFADTIDAAGKLSGGRAGYLYRPTLGARGPLHFALTGQDATGTLIAVGATDVELVVGGTTTALVTLTSSVARCGATPPAGLRTDFYVDSKLAPDSPVNGEQRCPFPSITAAVAAASLSSAVSKTVHVAAGTYDSPRERFPIELRNGISLVGEGAAVTNVVGAGLYDHGPAGGTVGQVWWVSLLIGDPASTQTLSGISLSPGTLGSMQWGIYCDQGNAYRPTGPAATTPNLIVDQVATQGFDRSIVIGTSDRPAPSGCAAKLTRSTVASVGVGLFVAGAGFTDLGGSNNPNQASVEVGDGTDAGANTFAGNRNPGTTGTGANHKATGVLVFDGSTPVSFRHNVFSDNDLGMQLVNFGPAIVADIDGNTFSGMTGGAVQLGGNYHLRSLSNNFFGNNNATASTSQTTCGTLTLSAAVCVRGYGTIPPGPQIERARNNVFSGNDVGLYVEGTPFSVGKTRLFDFGTNADPGGNLFVCNSTERASPGYDVWFNTGSSSAVVPFAGNGWDHATPTRGAAAAADRIDLVVTTGGPTLDLAGSVWHGKPCPSPHNP